MSMSPGFNFTKLKRALKMADEMCQPISDEGARWVGELIQLTLWRNGTDIPDGLPAFTSSGSIDRARLLGPVRVALDSIPEGSSALAEQQLGGVGLGELGDALDGYVKYHGDRGPVSGWKTTTSQNR